MKRMKRKRNLKIALHPLNLAGKSIVYLYALILIVPLSFAIITAFKTGTERVLDPLGLPAILRFDNFITAWEKGNLLNAIKNSVIISFTTVALQIASIIFVTFHLDAIRDTKVGNGIYMVIISSMVIPSVSGVTSLMMRREMGLYNNLIGEILCGATGIAFGIFVASGFLRTIPRELQEAAMIDGATDFQIMTRVITPVIKPALVSVGILNFTGSWNNTTGVLITLRDKDLYTIPMTLLLNFTQQVSVQYEIVFAGVIMTSIPLIVAYCYCQKFFVTALAGSVKG